MLTRFVRIQLAIFAVASVVGVAVMVMNYLQAPTLLGVGRIAVTLEMPQSGGLYRFANVTYRGVQIGRVTGVDVQRDKVIAQLSLDASPPVPADVVAEIRSVSAVGEQYVDLNPRTKSPPYLGNGAVIPEANVVLPQQVGPMMDQLSALVTSIPKDKLSSLLDETFAGLNGAAPDLQTLIDSSSKVAREFNAGADRASVLIEDAAPVLDSQAASADALRGWTRDLAGVGQQLVADDPQVRTLLADGPGAAQEVARLLDQVKPTLPVLLANLTTLGQVGVTYHAGLQQLLVLLPPAVSYYQGEAGGNNNTGMPVGDFRIQVDDPPACTVGFLPPSAWRSPADTTTVDTPDGLYCKLPQDSPIAVRGARNYPCMGVPGKYAPTVQECYSDTPFAPLAMRQHALGPYSLDPNLLSQGVPPDYRVGQDNAISGPVEGTPAPPGEPDLSGPAEAPPPPPVTPAAPSAFAPSESAPGPSVGIAHYDQQTGRYATPDGRVYEQQDLTPAAAHRDWRDLIFSGGSP